MVLLNELGMRGPIMQYVRFTANNMLVYSPLGHGGDGMKTWNVQREQTQHLTEFETLSFREVRKIFSEFGK